MKAILILSITCMAASGIFGVADFANDLNNGTLIRYEDEKNVVTKETFQKTSVAPVKKINGKLKHASVNSENIEVNDNQNTSSTTQPDDESVINFGKVRMKYFSRGMPPELADEEIVPENDSAIVSEEDVTVQAKESGETVPE
jgi:hypothetical protein